MTIKIGIWHHYCILQFLSSKCCQTRSAIISFVNTCAAMQWAGSRRSGIKNEEVQLTKMLLTGWVPYLRSPYRYQCYYIYVAGAHDWDKFAHLCQNSMKHAFSKKNCEQLHSRRQKETNLLTSDISCTNKRGILMVVMSCVQQTLRMFLSPMIAGSRAVMFPDLTLSSTQRWNATWISERFEWRVM